MYKQIHKVFTADCVVAITRFADLIDLAALCWSFRHALLLIINLLKSQDREHLETSQAGEAVLSSRVQPHILALPSPVTNIEHTCSVIKYLDSN